MTEVNTERLTCANHPDRETSLRCNRCEKPICPQCAVLTPTGYRCKECVRGHQKIFDTATWYDYPLAFISAFLVSLLGSYISRFFGFFTLILAPIVGVIIAEAVRFVIRKRRSSGVYLTAAIATALGGLSLMALPLTFLFLSAFNGEGLTSLGGAGLSLVWQSIYIVLVTSSMYYRLSGISLGR